MTKSNRKTFTMNYGGKEITLETGHMAKQADGAVWISCGGTQLLVTVVSAKEVNDNQDFFPLLVDYRERFYAGGKFLGGFSKREGRPSNSEILLMRMVDRPFRPLFPEGYMAETVISAAVHSYDQNGDPEVLAGLGAAAALCFSDVPFQGSVGFCKVGRINGQFVLNPSHADLKNSELEIVVAGSKDAISMVEGEADEVSEEVLLEAIMFGHKHIQQYCEFLDKAAKEVGKKKRDFKVVLPPETMTKKVEELFTDKAKECLKISAKLDRQDVVKNLGEQIKEEMTKNPSAFGLTEDDDLKKKAAVALDNLMYKLLRQDILKNGKRIGGRKLDEVRPIETEVGVLKVPHGSSLFTRGETQVLAAVTMGGKEGHQLSDTLSSLVYERFYLHYTFAPYCVGEAKGYRGVGRREIGHGNLAERAIRKVLPNDKEFPYSIRVACEVTESNGSSSMASICSGAMALMDAGVPLKSPVSGVAMGLVKEGDDYVILTDILGDEDHLGDMDFKVAGTEKGITAIQMDNKITGITEEIFRDALKQAHQGRLHVLGEMKKTIKTHRAEFKEGVPRIFTTQIAPDKIGALIGPGGKNVKMLQEEFAITVEALEDGTIKVMGVDSAKIQEAIARIDMQINGPKIGTDYDGVVVSIKEYGAFVDLAPNISGLLHISEVSSERVKEMSEYVQEGDVIKVRIMEVDRFGKIKLSAKAVAPLEKKNKEAK